MTDILIHKSDRLISFGSCFADNIGKLLKEEGFDILSNPFGVLYNPASIATAITRIISGEPFTRADIVLRDPNYGSRKGIPMPTSPNDSHLPRGENPHRSIAPCIGGYTSFYHHGSFSRSTPEDFLTNANTSLEKARDHFLKSNIVLVTFGTAWVYRHLEKGIIVANCHKHLASEFRRERVTPEQIIELFDPILEKGEKEWIFTVSPIPHLKDGEKENMESKSILRSALHRICQNYSNAHYFPAFEIVTNQLGGYSKEVIPYVWKEFLSTHISI